MMTIERKEKVRAAAPLLAYWLEPYTEEVIKKVLKKVDEIIDNEFTMHLLQELYDRGQKEKEDFINQITFLTTDYDTYSEFNVRNNILTHADSYREVLADMYIRNK